MNRCENRLAVSEAIVALINFLSIVWRHDVGLVRLNQIFFLLVPDEAMAPHKP